MKNNLIQKLKYVPLSIAIAFSGCNEKEISSRDFCLNNLDGKYIQMETYGFVSLQDSSSGISAYFDLEKNIVNIDGKNLIEGSDLEKYLNADSLRNIVNRFSD